MRKFFRDNGLTLALAGLFLMSLAGQITTGYLHENQELREHGQAAMALGPYLVSGAFLSALFENWESEFLQMWFFVMLTAYLFQRGSPESKDPDEPAPQDRDPALDAQKADAPWPVRAGGLVRALYAHSLGITLAILFLISFTLHYVNSFRQASDEAAQHGQQAPEFIAYLANSQLWFESFQNWQSEFLSTGVLVVLAIFLRERGSPESKPVSAPHSKSGGN